MDKTFEKDGEYVKGDIVINLFTTAANPCHRLLFIRKGTCRQGRYTHKTYDCIDYSGRKVQLFRNEKCLKKVGHMDEFDHFLEALKNLRENGNETESEA